MINNDQNINKISDIFPNYKISIKMLQKLETFDLRAIKYYLMWLLSK